MKRVLPPGDTGQNEGGVLEDTELARPEWGLGPRNLGGAWGRGQNWGPNRGGAYRGVPKASTFPVNGAGCGSWEGAFTLLGGRYVGEEGVPSA